MAPADGESALGSVEVGGETYAITPVDLQRYVVVRISDRSCVGEFSGSSSAMFRLDAGDTDLLQSIVLQAIELGLLPASPSD